MCKTKIYGMRTSYTYDTYEWLIDSVEWIIIVDRIGIFLFFFLN